MLCLPLSHKQIDTQSTQRQTHINTKNYLYNQPTIGIWQVLRFQVDSSGKKVWVVFVIIFSLSTTVNMTSSPSLLANGCQIGCSEQVISQCPLCRAKLNTKFCMANWKLKTAHFKVHAVHCIPQTEHCTLQTAQCTLHIIHNTLKNSHCTLNTAHCKLQTEHYRLPTAHCKLYTTQGISAAVIGSE